MRRAAVTVVIGAALLLAGCGSGGGQRTNGRTPQRLCVVASLPLSGSQTVLGHALLSGLQRALMHGVAVGSGDRLSLCEVFDDRSGAATKVAGDAGAAAGPDTVAYFGETDPAAAGVAAAVLDQEGIPLLTPSVPPPPLTDAFALGADPAVQSRAQTRARQQLGCPLHPPRGRRAARCLLVERPYCTGIPATRAATRRYCVSTGPDLDLWNEPAVAYGYSAGRLLIAALRAVAAAGDDPADRQLVSQQLAALKPTSTPVGSVHFNRSRLLVPAQFSLYGVAPDGGTAFSRAVRAH